ncbi:MAG: hypothetical protein ABGX33_03290 [Cycloclasticus sp.]
MTNLYSNRVLRFTSPGIIISRATAVEAGKTGVFVAVRTNSVMPHLT